VVEASCHCGAVRLQVAEAPAKVTDCNCSICRRLGALWAYYRSDQVRVAARPSATIAYVQGDRTLAIHHCRTCGCTTHWTGLGEAEERAAINARLLPPEILAKARVRRFDGAVSFTYPDET